MSSTVTVPATAGLCHLPARFALARGGAIDGGVLAYERQGPAGAPVVVVFGGISAHRHCSAHGADTGPGWWEGIVGDRAAVDTTRFQVLSFDWLGGPGGSTAPRRGEAFPFVATEDQASALGHLLDELRIGAVHAIVGASYGGMVALQFGALAPERVGTVAAIAAPARSHAQASAWRAVQRGIVDIGRATGREHDALVLARALAMTTYRTPDELDERFADAESVRDWLFARGRAFASRWTCDQFAALVTSIDGHEVDARRVTARTALLAFRGDQLVPAAQIGSLARELPRCVLHREVPSRHGHDAFLKEPAAVAAFVAEVLR